MRCRNWAMAAMVVSGCSMQHEIPPGGAMPDLASCDHQDRHSTSGGMTAGCRRAVLYTLQVGDASGNVIRLAPDRIPALPDVTDARQETSILDMVNRSVRDGN